MCGVIDTLGTFAKDSIGEIASHPLQALGAAAGVPGYDPFFGGLFNSGQGGALISPTGNFTSGAWNDMYNANPNDAGALSTMSGVNAIADKVAPALAGGFASGALSGAGGLEGSGAGSIGADTFSTGIGAGATGDGTLGGLESGLGGSAMFGADAGTGTALGSAGAASLGGGGLGISSGSALDGLTAGSGTYTGALGGSTSGTGLTGLTGSGAQVPSTLGTVDTSGGALSTEGAQAGGGASGLGGQTGSGAPMGFDQAAAQSGGAPGGANANLGSLSASSPSSTGIAGSTPSTGGSSMDFFGNSDGTTGSGAPYGFGGQGGQATNVGVGGEAPASSFSWSSPQTLQTLMQLGKSGVGAYQQFAQQHANNQYANSISQMFSPNSPYAQQMQQTLARQDAAAGRNSQGGTRAVQLAAALTQAQAQALGGSNYAHAATATPGANIANSLFSSFANPQGIQNLSNFGSGAFNSLSSLFG